MDYITTASLWEYAFMINDSNRLSHLTSIQKEEQVKLEKQLYQGKYYENESIVDEIHSAAVIFRIEGNTSNRCTSAIFYLFYDNKFKETLLNINKGDLVKYIGKITGIDWVFNNTGSLDCTISFELIDIRKANTPALSKPKSILPKIGGTIAGMLIGSAWGFGISLIIEIVSCISTGSEHNKYSAFVFFTCILIGAIGGFFMSSTKT